MRVNHTVDYVNLRPDGIYKNEERIFQHETPLLDHNQFKLLKFYHFQFYQILTHLCRPAEYDVIYLRFHVMHSSFYNFLSKSKTSKNKIVLEIPTYPYEKEYRGFFQKLRLRIDRVYRERISDYIDRIVHFGPHKEIFRIRTINLTNGIDTSIPYPISCKNNTSTLKLIAVGKWQEWHGLDRLLNGILSYTGASKISLVVVGDGPSVKDYKKFVENNKLHGVVKFYSSVKGEELDEFFNEVDIGIGSLADHRKDLAESSPLKNREYCVRGIPFILSTQDLDFPDTLSFVHYVPTTEQPIDIEDLLKFKNALPKNHKNIMVKYGQKQLGWENKMREVIKEINNTD